MKPLRFKKKTARVHLKVNGVRIENAPHCAHLGRTLGGVQVKNEPWCKVWIELRSLQDKCNT